MQGGVTVPFGSIDMGASLLQSGYDLAVDVSLVRRSLVKRRTVIPVHVVDNDSGST